MPTDDDDRERRHGGLEAQPERVLGDVAAEAVDQVAGRRVGEDRDHRQDQERERQRQRDNQDDHEGATVSHRLSPRAAA